MSLFVPEPLPLQTLAAGKLRSYGSPSGAYTPTLTAPTNPGLGTGGFAEGHWTQHGPLVTVSFYIQFGTSGSSAGDGTYSIALPSEAPLFDSAAPRHALGQVFMRDDNAGVNIVGTVINRVASPFEVVQIRVPRGQTTISHTLVGATTPWTWSNNDYLAGTLTYLFEPAM